MSSIGASVSRACRNVAGGSGADGPANASPRFLPFRAFRSFLPFLPFLPFRYFLSVYSALQ